MTSKLIRLLGMMMALALIAAACGSETDTASGSDDPPAAAASTDEDAPEEDAPAEGASADDAPAVDDEAVGDDAELALADMSWDQVVAQAQEEGEITWFQWFFQDRFRPFVEEFEAEYGISVNIPDGSFDINHSKLEAEAGRDTGDIDVLSTTFGDMGQRDITSVYMPLDSLPELDSLTTVFERVDTMNRGVAFWGNQSGLAYNTTRTDEADLPQTFEELEAFIAANPNGFALNDPSGGGSGQSFNQSLVRYVTGSGDYFEAETDAATLETFQPAYDWLVAQDLTFTAGNADSLTRLNDGEFLLVPAWEDMLAGLQVSGELSADLSVYLPEFGMNGGKNAITIPANAPHPAAALVFINWLTSPDVQSRINEVFGAAPQHPEASDEFALIPNSQRANSTEWFNNAYGDAITAAVIEQVIGG